MKIAVGISGGVDSAVAALMLQREGHDVFGLFMKNWEEDDEQAYCAAAEDLKYAEAVCGQLGIPLHTVNFATEYWDQVFEIFLREYRAGLTPNPDVLCNREIKFKLFLEHAHALGAEKIATGHYAGVERSNTGWHLLKGRDDGKDQSYFLHLLEQDVLAQSLFPLAEMHKSEVRALAKRENLASCDRKDSTGICFIGEQRFRDFLSRYLSDEPGDIVDESGQVIGTHRGTWFYTIGQRTGLGIGGGHGDTDDAWYVTAKNLSDNRISVVQGHNHPALFSPGLTARQMHWINNAPAADVRLTAKIRHRQADQACRLEESKSHVAVQFEQPQRAIAPGQSVVLYDDRRCLGGGVIVQSARPIPSAIIPEKAGIQS